MTLSLSGNTATFTAYAVDACSRSSETAMEEYTERFSGMAGMDISISPTSAGSASMSSMMESGNTASVTLVADSLALLEEGANMVADGMTQVPGVLKIDNEFSQSRMQGRLVINAQRAMASGMSQNSVAMQVYYLLSGMTATTIDYGDEQFDVVLEYPAGRYDDLIALMDHPLPTPSGGQVTLSDIADIEYTNTLPSISRQDGQFITTVTATTTKAATAAATDEIDAMLETMSLPAGVSQGITAMDKLSADETSGMAATMLTALFLVFLVMAIQFDSPRLSLMVMLCIPFSLAGSFGLLFLTGSPMSIMGMMGFLMLFGIVVNNGILLVDAINELRAHMPLEQALVQAGITRLRPILMTTLTTILSMVPLILSTDSGMGMMQEMGFIIIGGLLASTVLTIFLMPSFYLLIRRETLEGVKKPSLFRRKKTALPV